MDMRKGDKSSDGRTSLKDSTIFSTFIQLLLNPVNISPVALVSHAAGFYPAYYDGRTYTREYLPYDRILVNDNGEEVRYQRSFLCSGVFISFIDGMLGIGAPLITKTFSQGLKKPYFNISDQFRVGQYLKFQYILSGKLANLTGLPFMQKQVQDTTTFESTCYISRICTLPSRRVSSLDFAEYPQASIMNDKVLLGNNSLSLIRCLRDCDTKTDDDEVDIDE